MPKGIYLNDSLHGLIQMSEYEKRVISSEGFNRLHDVYQNSTAYLTYPANRTKRFEHSIGTMKLCSDMFFCSVRNSSREVLQEFYALYEKAYAEILCNISQDRHVCTHFLGGDPPNKAPEIDFDSFRYSLIPGNIFANAETEQDKTSHKMSYQLVHLLLIQSIRVAALLHDIGHPPFSHVVEKPLIALYKKYEKMQTDGETLSDTAVQFLETLRPYCQEKKQLHEEMGQVICENLLQRICPTLSEEDPRYQDILFELFVQHSVTKIFKDEPPFSYLHSLIDSSLDGDRLDYVTRDALNSGLDTGKIDYSRIIQDMQIVMDGDGESRRPLFCVPVKAVNAVEDFIQRRFHVYKGIIFHHRVIKTDRLLESTVYDLIDLHLKENSGEEENQQRELSGQRMIPFDISGLWFPLKNPSATSKFWANALSQWNDSWLMTILKQVFYRDYYNLSTVSKDKSHSTDYKLYRRMSELLCNQKAYYSLIKRGEHFRIIDDSIKNCLLKKEDALKAAIKQILNTGNDNDEDLETAIAKTVRNLLGRNKDSKKGFILSFIERHYQAINALEFTQLIECSVKQAVNDELRNVRVYDCMVVCKRIPEGLNSPIYFYDQKGQVRLFSDISGVDELLHIEEDYFPVFYVYLLLAQEIDIAQRNKLLEQIGEKIGDAIADKLLQ